MPNISNSPSEILAKLFSERRSRPDICVYEAPAGDVEECISNVWSEVLRIDRIGRHDSLFELGGDSLHIIQVISRLRKQLEIEISLDEFFDDPTVSGLASKVQAHRDSDGTKVRSK